MSHTVLIANVLMGVGIGLILCAIVTFITDRRP